MTWQAVLVSVDRVSDPDPDHDEAAVTTDESADVARGMIICPESTRATDRVDNNYTSEIQLGANRGPGNQPKCCGQMILIRDLLLRRRRREFGLTIVLIVNEGSVSPPPQLCPFFKRNFWYSRGL
ncbi:hypothetical protein Nepgr_005831 [Nepenthes gracilis]|uniref:Uncharacterized protein n=1 Tax=Nepenthes gracilis TaxID=150966 RepID=A0AAD3S4D2_NEPGR|nr:hypothetical protein Nepgr_005831 [Nepenthes gracilis]